MNFSKVLNIVVLILCTVQCLAQLSVKNVEFKAETFELSTKIFKLDRKNLGEVTITKDSSVYDVLKFHSSPATKYSAPLIDRNISHGSSEKILAFKEQVYKSPTPEVFSGFEKLSKCHYAISAIDVEQNLDNNEITVMYQDSSENMWIGYSNGKISKINSATITNYGFKEHFPNSVITDIVEFQGSIWVATFGEGLLVIEKNKVLKLNKEHGFFSNHIHDLEIVNQQLYINTHDLGLITTDGRSATAHTFNTANKELILRQTKQDNDGNTFAIDKEGTVWNINNLDKIKELNVQGITSLTAIGISAQHKLAILYNDNQVGLLFQDSISINQSSDLSAFISIYLTKQGNIWLGTKTGEIAINYGDFYTLISQASNIPDSPIYNIISDYYGDIWVSHYNDGILKVKASNFKSILFKDNGGLTSNTKIAKVNGQLAFTSDKSVNFIASNKFITSFSHSELKNITDVIEFENGIFLTSSQGIYQMKDNLLYLYQYPPELNLALNNNLTIDLLDEKIVIGNYNYGALYFNPENQTLQNIEHPSLPSEIHNFFIDHNSNLWICSPTGGIGYINKNTYTSILAKTPAINDICQDSTGNIFLGSDDGLYKYDFINESLELYDLNNLVGTNSFKSVQRLNASNNLWLGTSKNLLLFNTENNEIKIFNQSEGIYGYSFRKNQSLNFSEDIYYFLTNKSLVEYNAYYFKIKALKPSVKIRSYRFNAEEDDIESLSQKNLISYEDFNEGIPKKFQINSSISDVTIYFNTNYWGEKNDLNIYYSINDSVHWQGPLATNSLQLNNLKNGAYKIYYKAVGNTGKSSDVDSLTFTVYLPFYKQTWFLLFVSSAIIITFLFIVAKRNTLNMNRIKSYSTKTEELKKLKILAYTFIIAFPLVEFLGTSVFKVFSANWTAILIIVFLGLIYLLYSYKRGISTKSLGLFTLINTLSIICVVFLRLIEQDFHPVFIVKIIVLIAFAVISISETIHFIVLISSLTAFFGVSLFYLNTDEPGYFEFVLGFLCMIYFAILNQILRLDKLNIQAFSDKILNTYDRMVIVYNSNADVVYTNPYVGAFFKLSDSEILGDNWYQVTGKYGDLKQNIKDSVVDQIKTGRVLEGLQESLTNKQGQECKFEWKFQTIANEYLIAIGSDITEFSKQQKELLKLSNVTESVNNGVVIADAAGRITWCNQSFLNMMEYEMNEIIGHVPREIFKTFKFETSVKKIRKKGKILEVHNYLVQHETKYKRKIWLMVNSTPQLNEKGEIENYLEIVTDVTEHKQREIELEQLSLVARYTQSPILILNPEFIVKWSNNAFSEEFGISSDTIIGMHLNGAFEKYEINKQAYLHLKHSINIQTKVSREFLLSTAGGEDRWMKVSLDPIYDQNESIKEFICILQDIQELKQTSQLLEEKNKQIVDSINYALKIQSSLLPNLKLLRKILPEYALYYRPKDIVSGDFYYIETIEHSLYIGIADCTGHGVPGAMMSSISNNALNNAILDKNFRLPSDILNYTDSFIKNRLATSPDKIADGMDIGLIRLNFKEGVLQYSGAYRPLIIISPNGDVDIINGTKKHVGELNFENHTSFTTSDYSFPSTTYRIYCFSDGIPDQFGGSRGKKMYQKNLIDFLVKHNDVGMSELNSRLEEFINNFTFDFEIEQTDDMLLFGAEITNGYVTKMTKVFNPSS